MTPLPPLDLILFFNHLVLKWNTDEKCGFCWAFTAPMRDSDLNEYQIKEVDKCCLVVAVTDYSFETVRRYNNAKYEDDKYIFHDFKLNVMATDSIGRNVYDEIKDHPLSESKWMKILKPIYDCVSADDILTFCLDLGYVVEIQRWIGTQIMDAHDNNYTGWKFNVRLKEQL